MIDRMGIVRAVMHHLVDAALNMITSFQIGWGANPRLRIAKFFVHHATEEKRIRTRLALPKRVVLVTRIRGPLERKEGAFRGGGISGVK